MRRYYITPPKVTKDIPEFLRKRGYDSVNIPFKVQELIRWAKLEYNQAMRQANLQGAMRFVLYLQREYSAYRILAESEGFKKILRLLDNETYNQLNSRERQFIRRTYELYMALGGQPVR